MTTKNIVFIDSQVSGYDSLIAGLADTEWHLLVAGQDGIAQMQRVLANHAQLDAIHIISHGSADALYLGGTVLNSDNLQNYQSQLQAIGASLTQSGDILLYGCNVAQSEDGQQFINTLAQLTGADVGASDDPTGANALGGDGILEKNTGSIESTAINTDSLDQTLGIEAVSMISFGANDLSLFKTPSFTHTFNELVWKLNSIHSDNTANQADIPLMPYDLHYSVDVSNIRAGFPLEISATGGTYDISYGVKASVTLPSSVQYGTSFEVNTELLGVNAASFSVTGPQLDMTLSAMFNADIRGFVQVDDASDQIAKIDLLGQDQFSIGATINENIPWTYELFNISNGTIADGKKLATLTNSGNYRWTNEVLGGRTVKKSPFMSVGYELDTALSGAYSGDTTTTKSYLDFSADARPENPWASLEFDLDDIFGMMAGGATNPVGAAFQNLDQYYRVGSGDNKIVDLEFGAASIDAALAVTPYISAHVDVKRVDITLTASTGETHTGALGSQFVFTAPESGSMTFTSSYKLIYEITPEIGLVTSAGFVIKLGEFEGTLLGQDIDLTAYDQNWPANADGSLKDFWRLGYGLDTQNLDLSVAGKNYSVAFGSMTEDLPTPNIPATPATLRTETDTEITEGNSGINFIIIKVIRETDTSGITTADYRFAFGQDMDAADFNGSLPSNGTLTFAVGEMVKIVLIPISGDTTCESNESFSFVLTSNNSDVTTPISTITLITDDRNKVSGAGNLYGSIKDDCVTGSDGNDRVWASLGNDIINLGAGNDYIDAGGGIDKITYTSGSDTVDGGAGFDVLTVDTSSSDGNYQKLSYDVVANRASTLLYNTTSFDEIHAAVTQPGATITLNTGSLGSITWTNIERVSLTGVNNVNRADTSGDSWRDHSNIGDLLLYQGAGSYHGGSQSSNGADTFYADWSTASEAVNWVNKPAEVQTVHGVTVSGLERLLLSTGSGDDVLDNTAVATDDAFITGAGNDSIIAGGGNDSIAAGAGNDTISAGGGNDSIDAGAGNDTINSGTGYDTVDGGTGFDVLTVDTSSSDGNYQKLSYDVVANRASTLLYNTTSFDEIHAAVTQPGATITLNTGSLGSITWTNIERVSLTGVNNVNRADTSGDSWRDHSNIGDLLLYQGAGSYHGGSQSSNGADTFYADWSTASEAVNWVNKPAEVQTVHGVTVSGLERLLLSTGSGDDILDNTAVATNDAFITGVGNDSISAGEGHDSIDAGVGNDTLDGGTGVDTAIYTGNRADYTFSRTSTGFTISSLSEGIDTLTGIEILRFADATVTLGANNLPTGGVTLSGASTQDKILTAAHTLADADGLGTVNYQWLADGSEISGATDATLTLTQAQVDKAISVKASYTDLQGTAESVTSAVTAKIANVNDTPTGTVMISGKATQGQKLTAANTLADADGLGAISYQWLADGTAISGATASTLTLTQAQVGKAISVQANYTDLLGTAESKTSAVMATKVTNVNDLGTVTISGAATQKQVLTATVTDADGVPTTGMTYQWLANGVAITGATAKTFTLGQAQVGKAISVKASYTDLLGTAESKTSAATAMVASPSKTGTTGNDVLGGGTGNDLLSGLADNDTIYGGLGNDTLVGGAGADRLTGGAGNDSFKFNALADLGLGASARDVITDFKQGEDKISLSSIDTNTALMGDQAFAWVTNFGTTPGQVRFAADGQGNGIVYLNTDTDTAAEYEIMLTGVTTLTEADLVL